MPLTATHPHDALEFAKLQGFYEYLTNGPDCGRTHETDADWNEAYDEGRNEAEALDGPEGRKPFSVPEISVWMDEGTYLHASQMIDTAARLFGDGEGRELGRNVEYERAQGELICDVTGIGTEHLDEVISAIHATALALNTSNAA